VQALTTSVLSPGTYIQFFPGGRKILTDFLGGGGQNMKKYKKQNFVGKNTI